MAQPCLICLQPLPTGPGELNVEHIVARVLGGDGWLTTRLLCRGCNSRLGHDVDKVADVAFFRQLGAEAGLAVPQPIDAVALLPGALSPTEGLLRFDGGFHAKERVNETGGRVSVQGPTLERAQALANDLSAKRLRRGRKAVDFAAPEQFTDEGPVLLDQRFARVEYLNDLVPRLVAKVAVEYVAYIGGLDAALDPRLDALRKCAIEGGPLDVWTWEAAYDRLVFLPRTRILTGLFRSDSKVPTYEEQLAWLADSDAAPPPGAVPLRRLVHSLRVWRDSAGGHFELMLFSWLRLWLDLPADLPIPWTRAHARDLLRGRQYALYG